MYAFPQPIIDATLIKRYKRFLADLKLNDGTIITAHCANTGSMAGLLEPGNPCLLTVSNNPKRKYQYSWIAVKHHQTWVGIDTGLPNKYVKQLIEQKQIPAFTDFDEVKSEQRLGAQSRIDLLLTGKKQTCYIEIKNVTLVEGTHAMFPDAVTSRGLKHLHELTALIPQGIRAAMVYVIQRDDCSTFSPANHIDPNYSAALLTAAHAGVEIYPLRCGVNKKGVQFIDILEYELD